MRYFWRYTQIILIPPIIKGHQVESSNEIVIDQTLADKGFKIGDILSLSQSDEKLKVVGIVESAKYNASCYSLIIKPLRNLIPNYQKIKQML